MQVDNINIDSPLDSCMSVVSFLFSKVDGMSAKGSCAQIGGLELISHTASQMHAETQEMRGRTKRDTIVGDA